MKYTVLLSFVLAASLAVNAAPVVGPSVPPKAPAKNAGPQLPVPVAVAPRDDAEISKAKPKKQADSSKSPLPVDPMQVSMKLPRDDGDDMDSAEAYKANKTPSKSGQKSPLPVDVKNAPLPRAETMASKKKQQKSPSPVDMLPAPQAVKMIARDDDDDDYSDDAETEATKKNKKQQKASSPTDMLPVQQAAKMAPAPVQQAAKMAPRDDKDEELPFPFSLLPRDDNKVEKVKQSQPDFRPTTHTTDMESKKASEQAGTQQVYKVGHKDGDDAVKPAGLHVRDSKKKPSQEKAAMPQAPSVPPQAMAAEGMVVSHVPRADAKKPKKDNQQVTPPSPVSGVVDAAEEKPKMVMDSKMM